MKADKNAEHKKQDPSISISVGELVGFACAGGSLSSRAMSPSRGLAGTREHQATQKERPEGYTAEVAFKFPVERNDFRIEITGRIDGIFTKTEPVIIEEIKTTERDLTYLEDNPNPIHEAQLKCYSYIYASLNMLPEVETQLTYINLYTKGTLELNSVLNKDELELFFFNILDTFIDWAKDLNNWKKIRNSSIGKLDFPYGDFRAGQRDMSVQVFRTIRDEKKLFVQAPTGTGKTIASLFPAIKNLGENHVDKIFYLTAKTIGRTVAEKALNDMRDSGLRLKSVMLTAKEKICFKDEMNCDPAECEYARGYYDKLKEALKDIYRKDHFNREVLEELGREYEICPFELSLDLSIYCDCIICDYNYVFDPRVYLKRFFEQVSESYTLLVDETHNLPDRARSMYSASLSKSRLMDLKRDIKKNLPDLEKKLQKINKIFLEEKNSCIGNDKRFKILKEPPSDFIKAVRLFLYSAEKWLEKNKKAPYKARFLEFYFECSNFIKMTELFDTNYIFYTELRGKSDIAVTLFCNDPSPLLINNLKRCKSAIFFSATLLPMKYFHRILLGGQDEAGSLILPSPFDPENLNLIIQNGISTKFRNRDQSYDSIADIIENVYSHKKGNYLIYFPSFIYMEKVVELIEERDEIKSLLIQERKMDEPARDSFIANFTKTSSVAGFAVMGGIFGEGIDLIGERLIGVIVIGVGLPQICLERNLIKDYFASHGEDGFAFSYQYPGFNRVMQAGGRLIRTETDKGNIILIDERFSNSRYKSMFPREWHHYREHRDIEGIIDSMI